MDIDEIQELRNAQQLCRSATHRLEQFEVELEGIKKLIKLINETSEKLLNKV